MIILQINVLNYLLIQQIYLLRFQLNARRLFVKLFIIIDFLFTVFVCANLIIFLN